MTEDIIHAYQCNVCNDYTITRQVDDGDPPATTDCRAHGFYGCPGTAYRIESWDRFTEEFAERGPRWEWVNLSKDQRPPSDENAAVAFALKHTPLTLRAIREETT